MNIFGFVVDLFWIGIGVALLLGLVYLSYAQGWFGVATTDRMRIIIDGLQRQSEKINASIDTWQAKVAAKEAAAVPPVVSLPASKTKAERIGELGALLAAGTITQAEHDAAKLKILTD